MAIEQNALTQVENSLKATVGALAPTVIKLEIRGMTGDDMGFPVTLANDAYETRRLASLEETAQRLGISGRQGTGFKIMDGVSRVRLGRLVDSLLIQEYVFRGGIHLEKQVQTYNGRGKKTRTFKCSFSKPELADQADPPEAMNNEFKNWLDDSYFDQVVVYMNPSLEIGRLDSIIAVVGDRPKETTAKFPGQLLSLAGAEYLVEDKRPPKVPYTPKTAQTWPTDRLTATIAEMTKKK